MSKTKYLTIDEVLIDHARVVDQTSGAHGVSDINKISSLVERPKTKFNQQELYPTIFDKAASYFDSCANHHPFNDGNKRTAIAIAAHFLYLNGLNLTTSNKLLEKFVLAAVVKKYELPKIAKWFQQHTEPIKN